jgi:thiol-disulfide isomerase/thioredoxin
MMALGPAANRPPHIWLEPDMRRIFLSLVASAAIAGCHRQAAPAPQATPATTAPAAATPGPQVSTANAGKRAPDTAFEGADGISTKLSNFKGTPVLVNFWATWCAPCVREMPTLDALATAQGNKLNVLTISQDMQGHKVVDGFFKAHAYKTLKPWLDKTNALMLATREASLPVSILYDKDGKELWRVEGDMDWSGAKAKQLLAQAGI